MLWGCALLWCIKILNGQQKRSLPPKIAKIHDFDHKNVIKMGEAMTNSNMLFSTVQRTYIKKLRPFLSPGENLGIHCDGCDQNQNVSGNCSSLMRDWVCENTSIPLPPLIALAIFLNLCNSFLATLSFFAVILFVYWSSNGSVKKWGNRYHNEQTFSNDTYLLLGRAPRAMLPYTFQHKLPIHNQMEMRETSK